MVAAIWFAQSGMFPHPEGSQFARVAQLFVAAFCQVIAGGVPLILLPCQLKVKPSVVLDQLFMLIRKVAVIPAGTKARLGLDTDRSWIILTEANRFRWPGPDLRPVPGDTDASVAYGLLPAGLYDIVRTKWLAAYDARLVGQVQRTS